MRRDRTLTLKRDKAIHARYKYYDAQKKYRSDWIMDKLSEEFYLSIARLYQILKTEPEDITTPTLFDQA